MTVPVEMTIKIIIMIFPNIAHGEEDLFFPLCDFFFFAEIFAAGSFPSCNRTSIFPAAIEVDAILLYSEDGCGMMLVVDSILVEERFSTSSGTLIDPGIAVDKTLISDERCGFMLRVSGMYGTAVAIEEPPPVEDESCGQMRGVVVVVTGSCVVSLQSVMWPSKKYPLGHLCPHFRLCSVVHS